MPQPLSRTATTATLPLPSCSTLHDRVDPAADRAETACKALQQSFSSTLLAAAKPRFEALGIEAEQTQQTVLKMVARIFVLDLPAGRTDGDAAAHNPYDR